MFVKKYKKMYGKFIVVEGLEGSGKTSSIQKIKEVLHQYGIKTSIIIREPGGTPLSEKLRTIIKYGVGKEPIVCTAELLMIYAARIQLIERVIKPALKIGTWVIGDRHELSTQAYQGAGRGINKLFITKLHKLLLGDFHPNIIFYLDVNPNIGLSRVKKRGNIDRIEKEPIEFFYKIRKFYNTMSIKNNNIIKINANASKHNMHIEIVKKLQEWLKTQKLKK